MIRLLVICLLAALVGSYVTLAFTDVETAKNIGIAYSVVVATCTFGLQLGSHRG